jgi:hypothetical protein
VSFNEGVINVRTERLQGHTTFAVHFLAGNFGTSQTAGEHDFAPTCTGAHRCCEGHFHGAAERYTAFKLLGNLLAYKGSVQFCTLDFKDVDLDFFAGDLFDLFAQFVHFFPPTADNDTRLGGMNSDRDFLERALDHDFGDPAFGDTRVQVAADSLVFNQFVGKIFSAVPVRLPALNDA